MESLAVALFAAAATWVLLRGASRRAVAAMQAELGLLREQNAALGSAAAYLRGEKDKALEALRGETERRATAEAGAARAGELDARIAQLNEELATLRASLATAEERLAAEERSAQRSLRLLEEAREKLADAFKALSSEALQSNNQAFLDLARASLASFQKSAEAELEARRDAVDQLVQPLKESLAKVDGKLGEIERARIAAYSELTGQLKSLLETHLPALHSQTANLVKALRQPTVRGRWGEVQLKRVVEMAGMVDHCDFVEQESRSTEAGRFRPDLIVRLSGGKQIVIDAKAPVDAYLRAIEAEDEAQQRACLAEHARQVRDHMTALGRKAYFEQFNPTPEFVVLFLPGEVFFSAALQQDPGLIEFGVNERVIPATPTTLIALLRAVAYGWRQEALAKNAQEVADLGKQLYERIATLADHWAHVGERLGKAVESYNHATASLESRVLVSARRFSELQAAPADVQIPPVEPVERIPRQLQAVELVATPPTEAANQASAEAAGSAG
jgi:DNA recombination protein RmuC